MEATWSNQTNRSFFGLFRPKRALVLFTWPLQLKGVLKSFLLAIFPSSSTGFSSWKSTSDRIKYICYICIWLCIHFTFTSEHFKWRFSKLFAVFHVHVYISISRKDEIWCMISSIFFRGDDPSFHCIIQRIHWNLTDFFESQMSQSQGPGSRRLTPLVSGNPIEPVGLDDFCSRKNITPIGTDPNHSDTS